MKAVAVFPATKEIKVIDIEVPLVVATISELKLHEES
jgi:hypothetical protein